MLSAHENLRLMQVGPGTPMGGLMRRYWHPVAAAVELDGEPVKSVRLLGEDLVLYRDRSGTLGLLQRECAHRRVSLEYGIPEPQGLRCPYHGWLYDEQGRCLEQPAEPPDSTFKERITVKAYPVQELSGLIFAYLGPPPAPLLPRWDLLVREHVLRDIGIDAFPCNWLQAMENSMDPVHTEWLHGHYMHYELRRLGRMPSGPRDIAGGGLLRPHKKIGFEVFEHGIIKRRVIEGTTEEDDPWRVGHPVVFPNILLSGGPGSYVFHYRVPTDDTHTKQYLYSVYDLNPYVQAPKQEKVPAYEIPVFDEKGRHVSDFIIGQDQMAWTTQGPMADRTQERLAESDKGIILFRRLLREQLAKLERGEDPINVFRDPAQNVSVKLPKEEIIFGGSARERFRRQPGSGQWPYTAIKEEVEALFARAAEAVERSGS